MADQLNFEAMSVDRLWDIYNDLRGVLTVKISAQKRDLDDRLQSLGSEQIRATPIADRKVPRRETVVRRSYPKVLPLYRNPDEPSETWSGRGNRPRWLAAKLAAGKNATDFLINPSARSAGKVAILKKRKAKRS